MYLVNRNGNNLDQIKQITFSSAGFKERQHLQEWIAKNPGCLGEDILIIQKEFAGFGETKERLDLLGLDKDGSIVVIENKLDDTGKDVVWQALKYVSYCSSLSVQDIEQIFQEYLISIRDKRNAKDVLTDFFGDEEYGDIVNSGYSQRIILVAGEYRKEVTSTVMWLLNNGINISCFKVTPFSILKKVILDFKQIIPLKEAEDYMIKIAAKQKEEVVSKRLKGNRFDTYEKFWKRFLEKAKNTTDLVQNNNAVRDSWIRVGLGKSGISLNLVVTGSYVRGEIYINRGSFDINKQSFDKLFSEKNKIDKAVLKNLVWERMNESVTSRIKWQMDDVSVFDEENHEEMVDFLIKTMVKMHNTFKPLVLKLKG
jgi:hypothetical protein